MKDYHINIFFSEDDECYIADIPSLSFYSAFGKTPVEVLKEVEKVKKAWMDVVKKRRKSYSKAKISSCYLSVFKLIFYKL